MARYSPTNQPLRSLPLPRAQTPAITITTAQPKEIGKVCMQILSQNNMQNQVNNQLVLFLAVLVVV
jgi:hypothetical protein